MPRKDVVFGIGGVEILSCDIEAGQGSAADIIHRGCVFRGILDTDSNRWWTVIPNEGGQGFRRDDGHYFDLIGMGVHIRGMGVHYVGIVKAVPELSGAG